jgi:hypothetical protein
MSTLALWGLATVGVTTVAIAAALLLAVVIVVLSRER